ncbi:MAG: hypothetical protein ACI8WB_001722 [Phenylobacterium sp.]|jgi:hypothetical protein
MHYIDELEVNGQKLYRVPVASLKDLGLDAAEVTRLTLVAVKSYHKQQVKLFCAAMRANVTRHADACLLAQWSSKAQRAERVVAGSPTAADTEILSSECLHRDLGETPEQLATKQNDKNVAQAKKMSLIDGVEKATVLKIDGLSEVELAPAMIEMKIRLKGLLAG